MFIPGLCSITFRKLTVAQIVALVKKSAVKAVEWGGDVHVPHGDLAKAREVRKMTEDAGLTVASYGSYYRLGEEDDVPFADVVASAKELGTKTVRVWAGRQGSAEADDALWKHIVKESRRIAAMAEAEGMIAAYEYHGNTLTDTKESALRLVSEVNHPAMKTYWQPFGHYSVDENLLGLQMVLPYLVTIHAFSWAKVDGKLTRQPLAAGKDVWAEYLARAATSGLTHHVLLEFVAEDSPDAFLRDAETLSAWVR